MNWLLDTNVLIASMDRTSSDHADTLAAIAVVRGRGHAPVAFPQNMYEFWVASTRPVVNNGRGLTPAQAAAEIATLETRYAVLDDLPLVYPTWKQLVITYAVVGKPAHDARLVAAMQVRNISHVVTFNTADFARFPGVVAVHPTTLVGP